MSANAQYGGGQTDPWCTRLRAKRAEVFFFLLPYVRLS